MVAHHYNLQEWADLSQETKALCIAYLRLQNYVDNHKNQAVERDIARRRRQDGTQ